MINDFLERSVIFVSMMNSSLYTGFKFFHLILVLYFGDELSGDFNHLKIKNNSTNHNICVKITVSNKNM